jgi:uncharacterized protein (TIGR01777 family)
MKIFITGGTGFVGRSLCGLLEKNDHQLTVLTRHAGKRAGGSGRTYLVGDPLQPGDWQKELASHQVIINLAGASIFCRWTAANKKRISDSRILTTRNLVAPLLEDKGVCSLLVSASGVGYYGIEDSGELSEDHLAGHDFFGNLARRWEEEAVRAESAKIRVARCRFGVVIGPGGGAMSKMLPAFRLGLGSPLGEGNQWFPWIHRDDLCRAILHIINNDQLSGPFNFVAPQIPTNREFSKCLGRILHRPVWLPAIPAFFLRLILGEMANVVLSGQQAVPRRLLESGFQFRHETCESALGTL